MKCPYCGKELSKVEALLASFERTYFCPYCWHDITSYRKQEQMSLSKSRISTKGQVDEKENKSLRNMRKAV